MKSLLTILGGSSPFTAAFIDALAETYLGPTPLAPMELMLNGRSQDSLSLMLGYAKHRLETHGWTCHATHETARALDGATLVLHQIRYGGLAQRLEGEQLCGAFRLQDDETLGPAALLNAIRSLRGLESTVTAIKRYCPDAYVLNLTNPLSTFTGIMARELTACVGLCELPAFTFRQAAALLGIPDMLLEWQYTGLNHRGFITEIRYQKANMLEELAKQLTVGGGEPSSNQRTIGGITADCIFQLDALPLKYFRLLNPALTNTSGRANFLLALRARILAELRENPNHSPYGLRDRYMEWYPSAVVPMLAALDSDIPSLQVVNVLRSDGLVWELKAPVSRAGIGCPESASVNPTVGAWIERFKTHEHAFIRAVCSPTLTNLRSAAFADPTIPERQADEVAKAIQTALHTPLDVQVA